METGVVPTLALGWNEEPPPDYGAPIDCAGQDPERSASASTDDPVVVLGIGERTDQI